MVEMPVIDRDNCDGCGLCVSVCQCKRLVLVDNVVTVIIRSAAPAIIGVLSAKTSAPPEPYAGPLR
jgi:ferredoxin